MIAILRYKRESILRVLGTPNASNEVRIFTVSREIRECDDTISGVWNRLYLLYQERGMRALESLKLFGRDLSANGSVYRIYRELSVRSKYAATREPAGLRTTKYRLVSRINIRAIEAWTARPRNRRRTFPHMPDAKAKVYSWHCKSRFQTEMKIAFFSVRNSPHRYQASNFKDNCRTGCAKIWIWLR